MRAPGTRCIGLHFFSPANVMRLAGGRAGQAPRRQVVTAAALALAKRLGKLAVVAGNCPGFIGNRMLRAYRREAQLLLEEGASPRQVDAALEEWGMAMGPFAAQDLAGIDIAMSSRHVFAPLDRSGSRTPRVIDMLYAHGRLGQKTGAGWYRYDESRRRHDDPEVSALIERAARESGALAAINCRRGDRRTHDLRAHQRRRANPGRRLRVCVRRISISSTSTGYGFPAYRGGPMHFADEVGLSVGTRPDARNPRRAWSRLGAEPARRAPGRFDRVLCGVGRARSSRLAASEKAHREEA